MNPLWMKGASRQRVSGGQPRRFWTPRRMVVAAVLLAVVLVADAELQDVESWRLYSLPPGVLTLCFDGLAYRAGTLA